MQRRQQNGPPTTVKLLPMMSEAVFQQDGAPAHNAARTQEWCRANLPGFWEKGVWPGNSPDLSPIENIWAGLKKRGQWSPTNFFTSKMVVQFCMT